jgi:hypothetical protein
MAELLTREQFRAAVFARDKHKCVVCGAPAQDAHHILERRLFPDGGYYLGNGASVCGPCHVRAEETGLPCEYLRERAGITELVLPPHFDRGAGSRYDKWGNPYLPDGRRMLGELYFDPSVEKVLRQAGIYDNPRVFAPVVKYPRTFHLPWSLGVLDDDERLEEAETQGLLTANDVIVTLKMDGESCSMYPDHIHARSLESRGGVERDWVKALWSRIRHELPKGWRICGENLYEKHALTYTDLPSYFMVHSIWDRQTCLPWAETVEFAGILELDVVPVLASGLWPGHAWMAEALKSAPHMPAEGEHEGYVVRRPGSFAFKDFRTSVAKYVRKDHVKPDEVHVHRRRTLVKNGLRSEAT